VEGFITGISPQEFYNLSW